MHKSVEAAIKNRIMEHGRGWCFTVMHFSDLGKDVSIRKALSKLQKQNIIRRLTQGVYDYPEIDDSGIVPPSLNVIAQVIAEKNGVRIQPKGACAANLIGLCEQIPDRTIFVTEGPSRKVKIGDQEIIFKKTAEKIMSSAGTKEGLLIQALRHFGKNHIDPKARVQIANFLKDSPEEEIRKNMKYAPGWIRALVYKIMGFRP